MGTRRTVDDAVTDQASPDFDAIIVGTGFGGAVTACRLVEAGLKVCVLERGRRYEADDFPRYPTDELFASEGPEKSHFTPPPDFSRWLWSHDQGIYDVRDLGDAVAVQAAGYGGGSLIYANVHLRPPQEVFDEAWPDEYRDGRLSPYFDLAAYMLKVAPIPHQLTKTLQLQRGAASLHSGRSSWFRTPLAVRFEPEGDNEFGRRQKPCDMRGRCWRGCDQQAKNTLDLNYLAKAEQGRRDRPDLRPEIRTLAEVTRLSRQRIAPGSDDYLLQVTYADRRLRGSSADAPRALQTISARYVFLCAGSIGTTELLWRSPRLKARSPELGTRYFPNADSFSVVFDCDQPQEADYGPTITSALRYQGDGDAMLGGAFDFEQIDGVRPPAAGMAVSCETPGLAVSGTEVAVMSHEPVLDGGHWEAGTAWGAMVVRGHRIEAIEPGMRLRIGDIQVIALSKAARRPHWFLVEDGGYPPDLQALVGLFRSPLWLRRNRYLETARERPASSERVARAPSLQLRTLTDALAGTARTAGPAGLLVRTFDVRRRGRAFTADGRPELLLPGLLGRQFGTIFPPWFVEALTRDRKDLVARAGAFALPMLSRLLNELSENVASQIDEDTRKRLNGAAVEGATLTVLVRGLIRQALQVLAGSEASVATKAARLIFDPVPSNPGQLLQLGSDLALWAINYGTTDDHTGVLLTMGRDLFRGRLRFERPPTGGPRHISAQLPPPLLDTATATQERVLREIAGNWRGELRTNPAWSSLRKRLTVHSQGGCPMGAGGRSVTSAAGQLHACPQVYVMDAAAFPTSVGVNPSATIAAVAEMKVERFLREVWGLEGWSAAETTAAAEWISSRRATIDPLNAGGLGPNHEPTPVVIGLRFNEEMEGFVSRAADGPILPNLTGSAARRALRRRFDARPFTAADDNGVAQGKEIHTKLTATVTDLGRLVSASDAMEPVRFSLSGSVILECGRSRKEPERDGEGGEHGRHDETGASVTPSASARDLELEYKVCEEKSFLEMFVRVSKRTPTVRFFIYHLELQRHGEGITTLNGIKVLCDSPGMDLWHDTSTLFFELIPPNGHVRRGILRVSIEAFLNTQLRSTEVFGTTDDARRSWALVAFYKYFAAQLKSVYSQRADTFIDLLTEMVTTINV